jgi:hypothetical protein
MGIMSLNATHPPNNLNTNFNRTYKLNLNSGNGISPAPKDTAIIPVEFSHKISVCRFIMEKRVLPKEEHE